MSMRRVDVVIPARNEAETLPGVLAVALQAREAGLVRLVCVVENGSTDETAAIAERMGARVFRSPPSQGKGGAMSLGWNLALNLCADGVMFLDADLTGFRLDHVAILSAAARHGSAGQVLGLRDYGPLGNALQRLSPPITGERVVCARVLRRVPAWAWSGYSPEVALNETCARMGMAQTALVLPGMNIRKRHEKQGMLKGIKGYLSLAREVQAAAFRVQRESFA